MAFKFKDQIKSTYFQSHKQTLPYSLLKICFNVEPIFGAAITATIRW